MTDRNGAIVDDDRSRVRSIGAYAGVGAASFATFLALFRPFGWRFGVPWSYGLDNVFYAMVVRTQQLEGGYGYAPSLGAPYGQELYDFPQGGNRIHLLAWRLLGQLIDDPFTVINVWFAMGFVLITVIAFGVLRRLGVGSLVAGALAVVYAFVPYRFWHGLQHPPLSAYFTIPLGVLLAVWTASNGIPVLAPDRRAWRERRALVGRYCAVAAMVVAIGSSDPYFVVFSVVLVAAGGLIDAIRRQSVAPLLAVVLITGALGAVLIANLAPEILFRRAHGANDRVAERVVAESETYALHLTQMVAPHPDHRIGVLASLGARAAAVSAPGEGGTSLGFLGVVGLLLGSGAVLTLRPAPDSNRLLLRLLGSLQLAMALVATVGGVSLAFAVAGFTQIRSWGRMAVVIAFLALAVVGLVATPLVERARTARSRAIAASAVLVVALLAILDGTSSELRPDYEVARALRGSDQAFVDEMEAALPEGSMVFQLPVVPFPESPLVGMGLYDHLRPYVLGDDRLAWSFGGVKGRVHDWQEVWATEPIDRQLRGIASAGFAAVYVDTLGYASDQVAELEEVLGPPTGVAGSGRERWYDLRPFADRLRADLGAEDMRALGGAVVTSVRTEFGPGISAFEAVPEGVAPWLGAEGTMIFPNYGADGREITVRFDAVGPEGSQLRAVGPGVDETFELTGGRVPVELRLELPPGRCELLLRTDGDPGRDQGDGVDRRVRLLGIRAADGVVEELLGEAVG